MTSTITIPRPLGRTDAMPNQINPAIKPGERFATFHTADVFLNRLTGTGRDNVVRTPEYKVVAVRIEKVATGMQV